MKLHPGGPIFLSLVLGLACALLLWTLCTTSPAQSQNDDAFTAGETITFTIKKLLVSFGETVVNFDGLVDLDGQPFLRMVVTAEGFQFFDKETIYLDPQTFYPVRIERDLDIFGAEERIVEFYDKEKGRVRIVKTAKAQTSEQVIERGERFDNIYGFIYRYRKKGEFQLGEELQLHLPTRDVRFKLLKRDDFRAGDGVHDAYYMASEPKAYQVWFDTGPNRIPLMIKGAIGFGNTAMVLKSYRAGNGKK